MIRLEFQSQTQLMHMYQAMMAGKFQSLDAALLLSEPLAQALETLVDQLIADMRLQHREHFVDTMLAQLCLSSEHPQFQQITDTIINHLHQLDWPNLSEETQISYLKTAAKPLSLDEAVTQQLLTHIKAAL